MNKKKPSMDNWLKEARQQSEAFENGMYLIHNGVVRKSARAKVRDGKPDTRQVIGMDFSYDRTKVDMAVRDTLNMEGICHVRVWLNEGRLNVGDDIMFVLIGGDIRPRVVQALDYLVGRIKDECVTEIERFREEFHENHA